MELLKDRRIVLAGGAALALLAGLGIAIVLLGGKGKPTEPPPASRAGLIVETGRADDTKLDPARPLRCFVGGQFVGETTLAECAKKNGVATGALDVGVDETGALAAADQAGTVLTPLPPPTIDAPPTSAVSPGPAPSPTATASSTPLAACWRYAGAEWRLEGGLLSCVSGTGLAVLVAMGDEPVRLPEGRLLLASDDVRDGMLPVDAAAWVVRDR